MNGMLAFQIYYYAAWYSRWACLVGFLLYVYALLFSQCRFSLFCILGGADFVGVRGGCDVRGCVSCKVVGTGERIAEAGEGSRSKRGSPCSESLLTSLIPFYPLFLGGGLVIGNCREKAAEGCKVKRSFLWLKMMEEGVKVRDGKEAQRKCSVPYVPMTRVVTIFKICILKEDPQIQEKSGKARSSIGESQEKVAPIHTFEFQDVLIHSKPWDPIEGYHLNSPRETRQSKLKDCRSLYFPLSKMVRFIPAKLRSKFRQRKLEVRRPKLNSTDPPNLFMLMLRFSNVSVIECLVSFIRSNVSMCGMYLGMGQWLVCRH